MSEFSSPFKVEPQPVATEGGNESYNVPATPLALLAGAATALAGGLVWAGAVIATRYDIGIVAWLIGALTATVIVRIAGGTVGVGTRVLAGVFAAAEIMVGKYVIFVHAVRKVLGPALAKSGVTISYFDSNQISIFVHHVSSIVKPIYFLWVALAFYAAVRVAGGRPLRLRRS